MKLLVILSLVSASFGRQSGFVDHRFVTGFVVTPAERREALEERKSREIVAIIPESTNPQSGYPADCPNCEGTSEDANPTPTFRPYTQEELNSFLKKYVEEHGTTPETLTKLENPFADEDSNTNGLDGLKEKSKSWQLLHSQKQHHHNQQHQSKPYDDKSTGWVTLEPVAWSASQIQKWEPNKRPPQIPHWEQDYKPNKWEEERPWNKPSYDYKPSHKPYEYNKPSWSDNYGSGSSYSPDIITDGRPGSFPNEYNYQQQSKPYNSNPASGEYKPGDGDGRWVLLSSTKGYSHPQRNQRALTASQNVSGHQVKAHRAIKLTVLPSDNNATTISHGGLIEVEKGSQTVDEAQREHAAKMLKLSQITTSSSQPVKRSGTVRTQVYHPIRIQHPRNNAMIAAVGAGMIPATMAMLLPMVFGRKRRSIEFDDGYSIPYHQLHFY